MIKGELLLCETCVSPFVTDRIERKFCSQHCSGLNRNRVYWKHRHEKMPLKKCEYCNNSLSRAKSSPHSPRRFCNRHCATSFQWTRQPHCRHSLPSKICGYCQSSFTPNSKTQRFCTRKCSYLSRPTVKILKPCRECGTIFLARDDGYVFCSHSCSTLSKNRKYWSRFHELNPQPQRKCEQCSKIFIDKTKPYQSKRRFCSTSCRARFRWAEPNSKLRLAATSLERRKRSHDSHSTPEALAFHRRIGLNRVIPTRDTKIEVTLQNEIRKRGIKFVAHIPLIVCRPDLFFPEKRLAVFADGCYWHVCPQHHPTPTMLQKKWIVKDQYQTAFLLRNGYNVMRFWEHEIKQNVTVCVDKIANFLNNSESKLLQRSADYVTE